ncbi:MAG: FAD-dependent oxidoreductase [Acidobacteria bacterium]|nr:FAD-dependent oxidoreductase [Acidobacteriota bacterium]NIM60648.1 FAD-dependent oxidoreductase [Acidobacteriota bacterium]NIO57935.1 FAD-dependent oxidoreductase [Acidobacteriota bacterium]NIQ28938.1 FAD-dependent oxidoreductase [Acidobacteriota bacterium]NIQ83412.1 FAD-dependent oxidoreductase [Acidobacteriota bacterium]
MTAPEVAVLGGGLAGISAAWTLAREGLDVTLIESGERLGGLAGTIERDGHFYPLAYHHILRRDQTLLWFLERIGALNEVRWRNIRMLFHLDGKLWNLAAPVDFLRFPMSLADKLRFVRLMLRSFRKADWDDWHDRSAAELVDAWGGPGVREALFERLTRLKFRRPCDEVSAAWLGARLHFREGSAPLGFVPETNWTKVLCEGLTALLQDAGVRVLTGRRVTKLTADAGRIDRVECDDGTTVHADAYVSALPTEVYRSLIGADDTTDLFSIRYTAILSGLCVTRQTIRPDFYWMNLASLRQSSNGIFRLEALNPTIGGPGETCLNFVTHVPSRDDPTFGLSDEEIWSGYRRDFEQVFGHALEPLWTRLVRLPLYSPVFHRGYRNPPVRSTSWPQVYLAGNYRTFPSIASTGTALQSGVDAAAALLADHRRRTPVPDEIRAFRLRRMPRG